MRSQTMHDSVIAAEVTLRDGAVGDVTELVRCLLEVPEIENRVRALTERAVDPTKPTEPAEDAPKASDEELPRDRQPLPTAVSRPLACAPGRRRGRVAHADSGRRTDARNPSMRNQTLVPYQVDSGVIDYGDAETVVVEFRGNDGNWRSCGDLSLRDTAFGELAELAIQDFNSKTNLRIGDTLRLRGTLEKASFTRRSLAVQRVLGDRAVQTWPDRVFDPIAGQEHKPTTYRPPRDVDLEEYAEGDKKLPTRANARHFDEWSVSAPSARCRVPRAPARPGSSPRWSHYLITKEQARRISWSASHTKRSTTCSKKGSSCAAGKGSAIRRRPVGQRAAASDGICHLHSSSIEQSYREQFKAEKKQRIVELAKTMGLPEGFAESFVELRHRLGGLATRINELGKELQVSGNDEERGGLQARVRALLSTFEDICRRRR